MTVENSGAPTRAHTEQPTPATDAPAAQITGGRAHLGIELGSTRIKAVLIGVDGTPLATGGHGWENLLVDGLWTYSLDAVRDGLRACVADLRADVERRHGVPLTRLAGLGVSAMMHGYLAFDADGELLVPFRTWRNTNTGPAAAALTEALGQNIPLRWSIAHLYQAVLDQEPHLARLDSLTTLAGYVHRELTGRTVLGVGDASGMFPIDPATRDYDSAMLARVDALRADQRPGLHLRRLLPEVLVAGQDAGTLTAEGAALLDPTGGLQAGAPVCPPEGDAGTGMVASNAVAPRTGNVSVGTSVFAMVVLERPLDRVHEELDVVTTPAGDLVAMVHCNNGASELGAWADLFGQFAAAGGTPAEPDAVFGALLGAALDGETDAGGVLAYNQLSGEPIAGITEGRPLIVRTPESRLTLANLMRAQVYGVFATLSLGMQVLQGEDVAIDSLVAHGGLFRTAGVAQRFLAAATGAPVAVARTAGEGGPWGMALLSAYAGSGAGTDLATYLRTRVFDRATVDVVAPDPDDVAGYATFLQRYRAGLDAERAAVASVRTHPPETAVVVEPEPAAEPNVEHSPGRALAGYSAEVRAEIARVRQVVSDLHAELPRWGLVVWTAGNVSQRVRVPDGDDLLVIKPSGVGYDELTPESMVVCDLDGTLIDGDRSPSSDTAAHAYVYKHMPHVGGVVHTHSTYATAWAARGEPIPCVLTMMADEFGGDVPIGPFALIGDDSIGKGIVETLRDSRSRAVLMRNHGPFTIGRDARDAVKAAVMVEEVARTVHIAREHGEPLPIPTADIDSLYARYQNVYGQGDSAPVHSEEADR